MSKQKHGVKLSELLNMDVGEAAKHVTGFLRGPSLEYRWSAAKEDERPISPMVLEVIGKRLCALQRLLCFPRHPRLKAEQERLKNRIMDSVDVLARVHNKSRFEVLMMTVRFEDDQWEQTFNSVRSVMLLLPQKGRRQLSPRILNVGSKPTVDVVTLPALNIRVV